MKYILLTILLSSIASFAAFSQQENDLLAEGNRLYKEGKYEEAIPYYKKALEANSSNLTALYNLSAVHILTRGVNRSLIRSISSA